MVPNATSPSRQLSRCGVVLLIALQAALVDRGWSQMREIKARGAESAGVTGEKAISEQLPSL